MPTAEVPLTIPAPEEILDGSDLPCTLRLYACFRAEAGAAEETPGAYPPAPVSLRVELVK